jgi:hypothetical protein
MNLNVFEKQVNQQKVKQQQVKQQQVRPQQLPPTPQQELTICRPHVKSYFNAGWGGCNTYSSDKINHQFCANDFMTDIKNNKVYANDICNECNVCIGTGTVMAPDYDTGSGNQSNVSRNGIQSYSTSGTDRVVYSGPNTDIDITTGELTDDYNKSKINTNFQGCIDACNNLDNCKGFNRPKNANASDEALCYLKSGIGTPISSNNTYEYFKKTNTSRNDVQSYSTSGTGPHYDTGTGSYINKPIESEVYTKGSRMGMGMGMGSAMGMGMGTEAVMAPNYDTDSGNQSNVSRNGIQSYSTSGSGTGTDSGSDNYTEPYIQCVDNQMTEAFENENMEVLLLEELGGQEKVADMINNQGIDAYMEKAMPIITNIMCNNIKNINTETCSEEELNSYNIMIKRINAELNCNTDSILDGDELVGTGAGAGAGMGTVMGTGMGTVMGTGMGSVMGSAMGSAMGTAMGSGMGTRMGTRIGTRMGTRMGTVMGTAMGTAMGTGSGMGTGTGTGT